MMVDNYLEFMPLAINRAGQFGNLNGDGSSQWATGKNFTATWGDPENWSNTQTTECFGVDNINGDQWLTLTLLGPHRIQTIAAIVQRDGMVPVEIKCGAGHPYALINFVPHSIEIWGLVGGMRFYWKARYRKEFFKNPLLGMTRECIEQSEVWGNPINHEMNAPWVWARGGPPQIAGQAPAIPFSGMTPIPIATESAWFQGIAKGYGPVWAMGEIVNGQRNITSCANSTGWGW